MKSNTVVPYQLTKRLIDLCIAYDGKTNCWLNCDGSSLNVNIDWNGIILTVTFNGYSNRIMLDKNGNILESTHSKLISMFQNKNTYYS